MGRVLSRELRWMPQNRYLREGLATRCSRSLNFPWLRWRGWNFMQKLSKQSHFLWERDKDIPRRGEHHGQGLAKDQLKEPEVRAAPPSCWIGNFSNPENISKAGKLLVFSSSLEDCAPGTTAECCIIFFSGHLSSAAFVEAGILSVSFCRKAHLLFFQRKSSLLAGFLIIALERSEHVAHRRTRWSHQCRIQSFCSAA